MHPRRALRQLLELNKRLQFDNTVFSPHMIGLAFSPTLRMAQRIRRARPKQTAENGGHVGENLRDAIESNNSSHEYMS